VRAYQYALDSNRLLSTRLPGDPSGLPSYAAAPGYSARYTHDAQGNMTSTPNLHTMTWDFVNRLRMTQVQVAGGAGGEMTFYTYDSEGRRLRKVTERQNGTRKAERIYLGAFELYREYPGAGGDATLERESLHLTEGDQRVALIEIRSLDALNADPAPRKLVRYQIPNHLASCVMELDGLAQVLSYEEFHPYGTTAYEAARNGTDTPKRYRYTGCERDQESGLSYHGARYYMP